MNIYRWKDENFHKQELGRPEKGKTDKPKSLVRSLLTTMRHEARTFLEKPDSLGLGEGLLTPTCQHLFPEQICAFNGGTPEGSSFTQ